MNHYTTLSTLRMPPRARAPLCTWLAVCFVLSFAGAACSDPSTPDGPGNQTGNPTGGESGVGGTVSDTGGAGGTAASTGGLGGSGGVAQSGGIGATGGATSQSGGAGGMGGDAEVSNNSMDAGERMDADLPEDPNAIWIATDGNDSNMGTQAMPLRTLTTAVERATAGSTIWITSGTYALAQTVRLATQAEPGKPIGIFAAPGARPVLDFSAQTRGDSSARGIQISGTYWHLRGLDVINAGDNCIHISGAHNTIELVNTYGCSDTGVQITANSSDADDPTRAAYNTVLNCDSHDNYDEANAGENADGFAAKLYIGPGNVFRGCRAWNNADDGWDLFASDDIVVIDRCWAISNGKIGVGQNNTNGDGNGFKLGGAARAGDMNMGGAVHEVTHCLSIENRTCGFVRNNNTVEPNLSMCGGRGDGRELLCSLSNSGAVSVTSSAAQAIAAKRLADGSLPPLP